MKKLFDEFIGMSHSNTIYSRLITLKLLFKYPENYYDAPTIARATNITKRQTNIILERLKEQDFVIKHATKYKLNTNNKTIIHLQEIDEVEI